MKSLIVYLGMCMGFSVMFMHLMFPEVAILELLSVISPSIGIVMAVIVIFAILTKGGR